MGLETVEKIREQLCFDAEILDDNKILHILLRMMNVNLRKGLKGQIGGGMLLFSMAEMLRLACEATYNIELKEEDELGFGTWMKDIKNQMYGSNQLYDSNRLVKNEFMRQYGLDYGVRARCYVEGDTEAGALNNVFRKSAGIEIKNMKGRVVEKGIVSFRESLRQDIDSQVFSVILIDSDNADYVRAIKKAAQNDEICGLFYLSCPDFEFGNFILDELAEIIFEYASRMNIEASMDEVKRNIQGATSGKALMKKLNSSMSELRGLSKGEEWGVLLMDYAARNPKSRQNENGEIIDRPIVEIVHILLRSMSVGYQITRDKYNYRLKQEGS